MTIPTKVNAENVITPFSIIDHIWISDGLNNECSLVIPIDITDHFPVITVITSLMNPEPGTLPTKRRRLVNRGREIFRIFLSNIHVNIAGNNINDVYSNYFSKVFQGYNKAFPVDWKTFKKEHCTAWITPTLRECIKKKAKLYRAYLKGKVSKTDYTSFKNRLTNIIRKSKALYYAKIFLDNAKNSKILWSTINGIMNRKSCQVLKEIKTEGEVITGQVLANFVNQYFVDAAFTVTMGLQQTEAFICLAVRTRDSCFFWPTNCIEVGKVIKSLKNKGSKLLDIHPSILKENCDLFSTHFVQLYNSSLEMDEYPDALKIARVNPCYKSGTPDKIDNYRPISALPLFSKIFEKLTLSRMNSFITRYNLLTPSQFGFRKGCNTTHAIVKLLSHIIKAYHQKHYSACFFLDLRKAFDTIDHKILLKKLEHYGFRGKCYKFLRSYYQNRKQYVHLNGFNSLTMTVRYGVPQGSILGPLCFSLFINDMPLAVEEETILFADDAAFVITAPTLEGLLTKIRNLFTDLAAYLSINRLVPNASKSKLMMFSSRPTTSLPVVLFDGREIEWVSNFKYLGVTITRTLSFSPHIDNVALNISRITGTIINLRSVVPAYILMKLYFALAYPHISNHIIVWGSSPSCHLKNLVVRMNNLFRIILGVKRVNGRPTISNDELYKTLGVLNLTSIFKYSLFKLLKLLIDGKMPEFWNLLLSDHVVNHSYNTRQLRFRHPALTCEIERRALPHQLILLYEDVQRDILEMNYKSSLRAFKKLLALGQ